MIEKLTLTPKLKTFIDSSTIKKGSWGYTCEEHERLVVFRPQSRINDGSFRCVTRPPHILDREVDIPIEQEVYDYVAMKYEQDDTLVQEALIEARKRAIDYWL